MSVWKDELDDACDGVDRFADARPEGQTTWGIERTEAATYVPENRFGWWGGPDTRLRCVRDDKVVFDSREEAESGAARIRGRGTLTMRAYRGKCGHWHVGRRP